MEHADRKEGFGGAASPGHALEVRDLQEVLDKTDQLATAVRRRIISAYQERDPSLDDKAAQMAFVNSLGDYVINGGEMGPEAEARFDKFYALYQRIFTIEEEQEEPAGFKEIMALNSSSDMQQTVGDFHEATICLYDPNDPSKVIGAINFNVSAMFGVQEGLDGNQNIVFVMTEPEYRKLGIGRRLFQLADEYSQNYLRMRARENGCELSGDSPVLSHTCEQNDPLRMTPREYIQDTFHARLDQIDRLGLWQHLGYRRMLLDYTQLSIGRGVPPCDTLSFNAKMPDGIKMSPEYCRQLLYRFFTFSCLKGTDAGGDLIYQRIAKELDRMKGFINLADDRAHFSYLKEKVYGQLGRNADTPLGDLIEGFGQLRRAPRQEDAGGFRVEGPSLNG